jgi:hypothetical protein
MLMSRSGRIRSLGRFAPLDVLVIKVGWIGVKQSVLPARRLRTSVHRIYGCLGSCAWLQQGRAWRVSEWAGGKP